MAVTSHRYRPGSGHWQAVRTEAKVSIDELRVHLHSRIIVNGAIPFSLAHAKTSLCRNILKCLDPSIQELCRAGPDIRSFFATFQGAILNKHCQRAWPLLGAVKNVTVTVFWTAVNATQYHAQFLTFRKLALLRTPILLLLPFFI